MTSRQTQRAGLKAQLDAAEAATAAAVKDLAPGFLDWVRQRLQTASTSLHSAALHEGADHAAAIGEIRRFGHDLKGQSQTFGYDLLATFGASLTDYVRGADGPLKMRQQQVIRAHLEAIDLVVRKDIRGNAGGVGERLTAGLRKLVHAVPPPK